MINRRIIIIFVAFLLGQGVQLLAHGLSLQLLYPWQIPVCAAAGFLVTVAVFAGVYLAYIEKGGKH